MEMHIYVGIVRQKYCSLSISLLYNAPDRKYIETKGEKAV